MYACNLNSFRDNFLTFNYKPGIAGFNSCHSCIDTGIQRHTVFHNQLVDELIFRYNNFIFFTIRQGGAFANPFDLAHGCSHNTLKEGILSLFCLDLLYFDCKVNFRYCRVLKRNGENLISFIYSIYFQHCLFSSGSVEVDQTYCACIIMVMNNFILKGKKKNLFFI